MNYCIKGSYIHLQGDEEKLNEIDNLFSYTDKGAVRELKRLRRSLAAKEAIFDTRPDWWDGWKRETLAKAKQKVMRHACHWNGETLLVPIGLFDDLHKWGKQKGIIITGRDERVNLEVSKRLLKGFIPNLRVPQAKALEIIRNDPSGLGLIRMATGVGKTALGQEIIRHYGCPSLFLVPSTPILKQTVTRFQEAFGRKNVGTYGGKKKRHSHITVATYQSVNRADPEMFKDYRLAIFDEVHHIAAETFFEVGLNRIPNLLYRYGLTADEERPDGGTLLVHAAAGPVIYSYDASEAIRDGYLAKPYFVIYDVTKTEGTFIRWQTDTKTKKRKEIGINVSELYEGDDYLLGYKNWIIGNDILTETLAKMVKGFNEDGKSVLVLVGEKEHGDKFKKYLPDAAYVYGGLSSNDQNIDQFNKRKLKTIVATTTLGEGADTVPVDVLINLMGGRFPKQANGRALRNDPDENGVPRKPKALIIDFDFSKCSVLNRHSKDRQKVHMTYVGEIQSFSTLI